MGNVKSLQLSFGKKSEDRIDILIRGVFWPFWPLRGQVSFQTNEIHLKLPGKGLEILEKRRIEHLLLDKLGAGVFVQLVLADESTPDIVEEPEPEEAPETKPKPKGKAKVEPKEPEKPPLEKIYLGFFADPNDARELGKFVEKQQIPVVAWMGNWREKVGVVT